MSNSPLLDEFKRLYDAGDKSRLLAAIRYCGKHQLVMPDWVVDEFTAGTDKWFKHEIRELGEALGIQRKGVNLAASEKKRRLKYEVYNRVESAKRDGTAVDGQLFAEIGKELHLGKTQVSKYYYEAKDYIDPDFHKK